jgi:hypothetical protein
LLPEAVDRCDADPEDMFCCITLFILRGMSKINFLIGQ